MIGMVFSICARLPLFSPYMRTPDAIDFMLSTLLLIAEISLPRGKRVDRQADGLLKTESTPLLVESLMLHGWPYIWKGFRRPITLDNQPGLAPHLKTANVWKRFRQARTIDQRHIFGRLFWYARWYFVRQQCWAWLKILAIVSGPALIRRVVLWVSEGRESLSFGVLLVLALFLSNFVASWSDYKARAAGWSCMHEIRTIVSAEVFAKLLRTAEPSENIGSLTIALTDDVCLGVVSLIPR